MKHQQLKDFHLINPRSLSYALFNNHNLDENSSLDPLKLEEMHETLDISTLSKMHGSPRVDENIILQHTFRNEIIEFRSSVKENIGKPPVVNLRTHLEKKEKESKFENKVKFLAALVSRYLNLEPSLVIDWFEISWEKLYVNERVGVGTSTYFFTHT